MSPAELHVENGAARLGGDLTFSTVAGLFQRMAAIAKEDGLPASIDLSNVRRIDSAGLALLLEWQSAYRKQVGNDALMAVQDPPDALMKIARLCDAEDYLTEGGDTRRREGS